MASSYRAICFMISPSEEHFNRFDIRSEEALRIRFLVFDKHVSMKSYDLVASDLLPDAGGCYP